MVVDVRLIHVKDFLRHDVHGVVDLEQSKRMMRELAKACDKHDNYQLLIDTRDVDARQTSMVDVWELAASLRNMGFHHRMRIAVVNAPKDSFDRAAFFEVCAQNRGFNLRVFRDFEQALYWLATEET
jgi:hypothetical protein